MTLKIELRKMKIKSKINDRKVGKINLISILSLLLLILMSSFVLAIPNSITLQGKLTDLSGSSQVGTFNFTFKIYDAFTNGNVLHQIINQSVITDANGIYDIILQNLSGLNFSDQYYLGIAVNGDDESQPRINLTSSPYSFRANISEDLNRENKYEVSVFNITGNLTIGQEFADVLTVTTGRLNISDGNIIIAGNLTLAERISFSLGSVIDNLISGFLRISGGLNVTGNVSIAQDTLFVDNTSKKIGIGTASPYNTLTVIGSVGISGSLNASSINTTGDAYFATSSGKVGIGTSAPAEKLTVIGNVNVSGYVNISGDFIVNKRFNVTAATGDLDVTGGIEAGGGLNVSGDLKINELVNVTAAIGDVDIAGGVEIGRGLNVTDDATFDSGTLYVDSADDRVGIGTTSPNDVLEVIGNVRISGSLNASFINASTIVVGEVLTLGWTNLTNYPGACDAGQFVTTIGDTLTCVTPAPASGGGWTDDGSNVRLNTGSDLVGIGTLTPLSKLHINDSSADGALRVTNISGTTLFFVNGSSGKVGVGTAIPVDTLTVRGSVSVFGTLNATFLNATEIRQGTNLVQTINSIFNLGNLTSFFGDEIPDLMEAC